MRREIAELTAQGRELPPPLRATLIEPEEIADAVVELIRDETVAGRVMLCWGDEPRRLLPNQEPSPR